VGKVFCHGGFADVSDGEYSGRPMAIKSLRMNEGDSDRIFKVSLLNPVHSLCSTLTQRLCREIITWKHLSHRNILPLFGISLSTDPHGFCVLTEWMPNGNVIRYARSNPEADRFRLVSPAAYCFHVISCNKKTSSSLKSCLVWPTFTGSILFTATSRG